ncbi:hypothetical protein XELAEV_18039041mg [Xenopus laevis]|uniref:Uncharacterized protein n=1 Tax=Xenopus laevis TaxID=8355 RepID=A0A974C707_XENLA|nr:hypothetical protein XELAEV_18039041mg [Xenopus laevis]
MGVEKRDLDISTLVCSATFFFCFLKFSEVKQSQAPVCDLIFAIIPILVTVSTVSSFLVSMQPLIPAEHGQTQYQLVASVQAVNRYRS